MYQPYRHLLQMHTTNYMPFIKEKGKIFEKKSEPIGGAAAPTTSPPLNPALISRVPQHFITHQTRNVRLRA